MENQKFYVIQPKNRNEYFISSNSLFPLDRKYRIMEVTCSFKEVEES
ncbi:hypothetical protein [Clostridium botulinum]|nr:hypothetical protein [Clostridium botulinum]MBY6850359.1 hypothetical protein [Clostridium botulinum]MBY6857419.1 hypothetical protein [Clostridium botulinum]MBY6967389.1 hypothetical protein [Clostridium botulinum]HBJ1686161.1 hypothetical protein [Clostridium botulinum]